MRYKLHPHNNSASSFLLLLTCIIVLGLFRSCLAKRRPPGRVCRSCHGPGAGQSPGVTSQLCSNHCQPPTMSRSLCQPGIVADCRDGSATLPPYTSPPLLKKAWQQMFAAKFKHSRGQRLGQQVQQLAFPSISSLSLNK